MVKRTITKHRVFFCGARTKLFFLIWKNFSSQKLTKTTLTVLQKFWRQPLTSWLSSCNFMKRAQRLLCSDPRWTAGRFKMCSVTFAPQMSESSVYSADSSLTLYSDSSKWLLTFLWDCWTSKEHQSCPWQFTLCQTSSWEWSAASTTTWKNATSQCASKKKALERMSSCETSHLLSQTSLSSHIFPHSFLFEQWENLWNAGPHAKQDRCDDILAQRLRWKLIAGASWWF